MALQNIGLTTEEAFKHVIYQAGIADILGTSNNAVRSMRRRLVNGTISNELMEEVLIKAGYKVVVEKQWRL
ncbi:MAG: hypothetical protein ACO1OF_16460 [Adhaeribacter sp.]